MKIGFVFDDSLDRNDGVQQYVKTLGKWLMDNGHEVRFLVGETNDAGEFQPFVHSMSKNFAVRFNKNRLSIPLPASRSKIKKVLAREDFDLLHIQAPFSPFMASKVINAAPSSTAVAASFHIVGDGWKEKLGIRLLSLLQKKALKRIDKYLAVSPAGAKAAESYFPEPAEVSPNVVELDKFRSALRVKRANKIVYLGRLVERKGAHHLVEAINILNTSDKLGEYRVLIASDGPDRKKIEAQISRYDLNSKIKLLGYIDEEAKPELLGDADLAVFPSTGGESFGIVLIEAMAAGALTLGGDNPGYSTVLSCEPSTLFNPLNHQEFADTVYQYLHDKDLRRAAYGWQSKRVKQFDVDSVGKDVLEVYRSIIVKRQTLENNHL